MRNPNYYRERNIALSNEIDKLKGQALQDKEFWKEFLALKKRHRDIIAELENYKLSLEEKEQELNNFYTKFLFVTGGYVLSIIIIFFIIFFKG